MPETQETLRGTAEKILGGLSQLPPALKTAMGVPETYKFGSGSIPGASLVRSFINSAGGAIANPNDPNVPNPVAGIVERSGLPFNREQTSPLPKTGAGVNAPLAASSLPMSASPLVASHKIDGVQEPQTTAGPVLPPGTLKAEHEASPFKQHVTPTTTPQPAGGASPSVPERGWWAKDGWKVSGKDQVTPLGELPTAVRVTKNATGVEGEPVLLEARGITEKWTPEQKAAVAGGVSGVTPATSYSDIDTEIEKIRKDPGSQLHGGVGLTSKAQANIVELLKAKAAIQSADKGHAEAAAARFDIQRENLAEKKRSNDILASDRDMLREQNAYIKSQDQTAKRLDSFHKQLILNSPNSTTLGEDGKPTKNLEVGLLDHMDRGGRVWEDDEQYRPVAQKLWNDREATIAKMFQDKRIPYVAADINKVGSPTYNARKMAIAEYRKNMLR